MLFKCANWVGGFHSSHSSHRAIPSKTRQEQLGRDSISVDYTIPASSPTTIVSVQLTGGYIEQVALHRISISGNYAKLWAEVNTRPPT